MAAYRTSATYTQRDGQDYVTADKVRGSYANVAAPSMAPQNPTQGKPVFVLAQNIPGEKTVELQEMYKAVSKSVNTKDIQGVQRIGGLWRLYITERENRIKLITQGLQIRDTSVRVYDKNPFLPHENENATRVLIKDIPLSVHENVILDELENIQCKVYGAIMYPKLRVDGKLTQCLTGDRVVYIDPPTQPLPRFMRFHSFKARVFHHGQPDTESNVICSLCLQTGHHRSKCSNEMVCRHCRKAGHLQASCPKSADKQSSAAKIPSKPKTQTSAESTRSPDTSRGEAVTETTDAPGETRSTNNEPDEDITSSARQTRSKTANRASSREKGSRDRKQRNAKEGALLGKVLSDECRSRSNSAPSVIVADDTQTKITEYWGKSSSETDEAEADDESDDNDPSYATPEPQEIPQDHCKQIQKGRKRRRRNTKSSNGKSV